MWRPSSFTSIWDKGSCCRASLFSHIRKIILTFQNSSHLIVEANEKLVKRVKLYYDSEKKQTFLNNDIWDKVSVIKIMLFLFRENKIYPFPVLLRDRTRCLSVTISTFTYSLPFFHPPIKILSFQSKVFVLLSTLLSLYFASNSVIFSRVYTTIL